MTVRKFTDSLGHSEILSGSNNFLDFTKTNLRVGDSIRWEVEVDSSFQSDEYTVEWCFEGVPRLLGEVNPTGLSFALTLLSMHVDESLILKARLISKRDWHRLGPFDAFLNVAYKVLPSLE